MTHGKLTQSLLGRTRPHNTHTQTQRKEKGTSLFRRPGRPAGSGRIVAKMAPNFGCRAHSVVQQLSPTAFRTTLSKGPSSNRFSHTPSPFRVTPASLTHRSASTRAFSFSLAPPPSFVPRPFWACLRSLGQSGQRTRLLRVNVTGGGVPTAVLADSLGLQAGSLFTYSALLSRVPTLRREIAPRLRRASIPPRGDRVHTVPLVGVCGEGGGVVASSMMLCGV